MDLSQLAAQYFSTSAMIAFAVSLLVSGAAFVVMRLYTRAVMRESQRSASPIQIEPSLQDSGRSPSPKVGRLEITVETLEEEKASDPRSATFQHAQHAFRHAAYCYVLAGAVHAASSTALLFWFGFYVPPITPSPLTTFACYAGVFWGWFFITVFALALFYGPERRFRILLLLSYAGMLPLVGALLWVAGTPPLPFANVGMLDADLAVLMLSFARETTGEAVTPDVVSFSSFLQPTLFLSLTAAPFMIPVLAFNRFIRGTVGPVFITFALMMTLGLLLFLDLIVLTTPGLWLAAEIKRLFADSAFRVLMSISFIAATLVACSALLWVIRRYRRTQLSDQTFLFDALWLSVSVCVSVYLIRHEAYFSYLLGLLPFVLYKLVAGYGLRRYVVSAAPLPNARLLFLRVFGSARRSEKLFDLLLARWRYAGNIQLISATDVARSRFEPDEFLDFVAGRFTMRYISSSADLEQRLAQVESRPDPDGRYRVNEYFCRADVWQETVMKLMERSDLAAMDLRGFTSKRRGCVFELGALIDKLPLERVVLLIDHTTDELLLRQMLEQLWATMERGSPNALASTGRVRMLKLTGGYARAVRRLMQIGDEVMYCSSGLKTHAPF